MNQQNAGGSEIAEFLDTLERMAWFSNIGKSIARDSGAEQLSGWEDWPGPEAKSILALHTQQQALYDELMEDNAGQSAMLSSLWSRIHEIVYRAASDKVPYDPDQDSWHGPTLAVSQAAYTAGLVGLYLYLQREIPDALNQQWEWFTRGHWPSGYADTPYNERGRPLLVY